MARGQHFKRKNSKEQAKLHEASSCGNRAIGSNTWRLLGESFSFFSVFSLTLSLDHMQEIKFFNQIHTITRRCVFFSHQSISQRETHHPGLSDPRTSRYMSSSGMHLRLFIFVRLNKFRVRCVLAFAVGIKDRFVKGSIRADNCAKEKARWLAGRTVAMVSTRKQRDPHR